MLDAVTIKLCYVIWMPDLRTRLPRVISRPVPRNTSREERNGFAASDGMRSQGDDVLHSPLCLQSNNQLLGHDQQHDSNMKQGMSDSLEHMKKWT